KTRTGAKIKLLIAGRLAWQNTDLQQTLAQLRHRTDVQLLGFVADADLPKLLGAALALTYVSLFEGFGVPVLEAMQAKVPVLTANRSSLPEVAGDAALLVDPTQVEEIATALQQLWESATLRQELIAKGEQQHRRYTWEKAADVVNAAVSHALRET
ncbi:MAG: glycosyltransferase family 1 protein, partial [Bacteroidota bacterium]